MKKSKRSDYIVITDKRLWIEHNVFPDGGPHSIIRLDEPTALSLAKSIQKHVAHMRHKYKTNRAYKNARLGYFIHLSPEISFFIGEKLK